jgi:hypothetical protein
MEFMTTKPALQNILKEILLTKEEDKHNRKIPINSTR